MVPMLAIPVLLVFLCAVQDKAPTTAAISGTVTNSATGEFLGKVELRVLPVGGSLQVATTSSDARGNFRLVDVPAGNYRLEAVRNGFLDSEYGARHPGGAGSVIALAAAEDLSGFQLKMTPASVIAGTVRDPEGEPVSGATVRLLQETYEYGRRVFNPTEIRGYKTDDLGRFRIADLPPGKYYVSAIDRSTGQHQSSNRVAVDHSAKSDEHPTALLPTLYPGVTDRSAARIVEVGAGGQVTGIDIALVRSATFQVHVQVDGLPVNRLLLTSDPDHPILGLNFEGLKSGTGDFEFLAVPAGLYTMTAIGPAPDGGPYFLRETALSVSRDMFTRINVQEPSEILVRIARADQPEAKVPNARTELISASDRHTSTRITAGELFSPFPGHYNLYVNVPGLTVKSMRAGNIDVLRVGLNVAADGAKTVVDVLLAADGGMVGGVVLDREEKPVMGATVLLLAEPKLRARYDSFHEVTADQHGRFHFENIRPGEYKLFAWDDVEENAWFDPEFLKKFEDGAAAVSVMAKGQASVPIHVQ